jgi:hypothetical protein
MTKQKLKELEIELSLILNDLSYNMVSFEDVKPRITELMTQIKTLKMKFLNKKFAPMLRDTIENLKEIFSLKCFQWKNFDCIGYTINSLERYFEECVTYASELIFCEQCHTETYHYFQGEIDGFMCCVLCGDLRV